MKADICMVCEGSYPYLLGGVSEWVHQLIESQKELTFHILSVAPPHPDLTIRYKLPSNVVGHTTYIVQELHKGARSFHSPEKLWETLEATIEGMISSPTFEKFSPLLELFEKERNTLGTRILCESPEAWNFLLKLYEKKIPSAPFKAYFASLHTLTLSLFSMLSPPLPEAKLFHSVCTGYAGFLLYRAKKELKVPCILTEHGIYSNERRIEIALSDWILDKNAFNLSITEKKINLKEFWLNAFFALAHVCYHHADELLTTFDGHQKIQIDGGADPKKVRTIVHGIPLKKRKKKEKELRPSTVAFIGRVVPIKDVKTFIRAAHLVLEKLPQTRFLLLGPKNEDPDYVVECQALIDSLGRTKELHFTGSVNLEDYFPQIDLIVLTSISEAQPFVILESGAVGIPCVATNVGACKQLIQGNDTESPRLGSGGLVTELVNPESTAAAIIQLLTDEPLYKRCSTAIAERINTYYRFEDEQAEYRKIYEEYLR